MRNSKVNDKSPGETGRKVTSRNFFSRHAAVARPFVRDEITYSSCALAVRAPGGLFDGVLITKKKKKNVFASEFCRHESRQRLLEIDKPVPVWSLLTPDTERTKEFCRSFYAR